MREFDYDAIIERILQRNRWGSERELAARLGISPNTWTAYKKGESSFTLKDVPKLCDVLEISPHELLFGSAAGETTLVDRVRELVAEIYREGGIRLSAENLNALVREHATAIRDELISIDDDEEVEIRLRLLRKKVRRIVETAAAEPGTGKRSA